MRKVLFIGGALCAFGASAAEVVPSSAVVDVVVTKEETKSKKDMGTRSHKDERIDVVHVVTVRNRSRRPLEKLQVDVVGEVRHENGKVQNDYVLLTQRFSIPRLEPGREQVLRCKPMRLQKEQYLTKPASNQLEVVKNQMKVKKITVTVTEAGRQIWVTK